MEIPPVRVVDEVVAEVIDEVDEVEEFLINDDIMSVAVMKAEVEVVSYE